MKMIALVSVVALVGIHWITGGCRHHHRGNPEARS